MLNESNLSMTKSNFYLKATITLDFVLTCNIKLGTAPTDAVCATRKSTNPDLSGLAGRKRRQTDETEFTQTTG